MASHTHFRPFRATSGQMLSAGIGGAAPVYGTRNLPPVSGQRWAGAAAGGSLRAGRGPGHS